jgi:hypothetical protein
VEHLSPGRVVVVVVEVLDDFEGPSALEHIPAADIASRRMAAALQFGIEPGPLCLSARVGAEWPPQSIHTSSSRCTVWLCSSMR